MASRQRPSKSSGPLDERQRKLLEEQEKLEKLAAQLNRVIEEAPRKKAERDRARRDELLVDRSTRAHHRLNSTTLADNRFEFGGRPGAAKRRRPLKAERRQTFLISCSLVVVLAIFVLWLLTVWHWQWPG
jgi:hypothetical protein